MPLTFTGTWTDQQQSAAERLWARTHATVQAVSVEIVLRAAPGEDWTAYIHAERAPVLEIHLARGRWDLAALAHEFGHVPWYGWGDGQKSKWRGSPARRYLRQDLDAGEQWADAYGQWLRGQAPGPVAKAVRKLMEG